MLIDRHNREVNYLRLSVTDKCNLRCSYCMPENMKFVPRKELLTYEEMIRISRLLVNEGVTKIRITGGEPYIRKDFMSFLSALSELPKLEKIAITTNGVSTLPHLEETISLGVNSFNLSLDSLDRERFLQITRRDALDQVMACLHEMLRYNLDIRLNCVVMQDRNIDDIIPMVELAKDQNISVRFIEEMPFNGHGEYYPNLVWNHQKILDHITEKYPDIEKLNDPPYSTSKNYRINGFAGSFGIIAAYTRTFCGSCNRIRITPEGTFKTCLYDQGIFNLKTFMRQGATDEQIITAIKEALAHKAVNGKMAESNRSKNVFESMSTIGG